MGKLEDIREEMYEALAGEYEYVHKYTGVKKGKTDVETGVNIYRVAKNWDFCIKKYDMTTYLVGLIDGLEYGRDAVENVNKLSE